MSIKVTIEGGGNTFEIPTECMKGVQVTTDIPLDSNARTKDVGSTMKLTGKILASTVEGDPFDVTRQLALWSAVPAEQPICYRSVTVEIVQAGIMERKYIFPQAFVIDYDEDFGDVEGTGTFTLLLKQKKDKLALVDVQGGFPAA